jgi:hypothetical protein
MIAVLLWSGAVGFFRPPACSNEALRALLLLYVTPFSSPSTRHEQAAR